jgi:hypothetical protein
MPLTCHYLSLSVSAPSEIFFLPSIGMLGGACACAWLYKPCQGYTLIFMATDLRSSWVNSASIAQSLCIKAIQELQNSKCVSCALMLGYLIISSLI